MHLDDDPQPLELSRLPHCSALRDPGSRAATHCAARRVGNVAWAHEYLLALPNTWSVVHIKASAWLDRRQAALPPHLSFLVYSSSSSAPSSACSSRASNLSAHHPHTCVSSRRALFQRTACAMDLPLVTMSHCLPLQDPVPRVPKFFYSLTGHRVSLGSSGDLIVRPSYFESSVLSRSGGRRAGSRLHRKSFFVL